MFNTKKVLPMGKPFYFWPHKLEIHFLPAVRISPTGSSSELKEKVFAIMKDHYVNNLH
jgi:1-acyl-sn-glycerol-3-phosphate acyltransferase